VEKTIRITLNDLSVIRQRMLDIGIEIDSFKSALVSHQAKVRRVLLDSKKEVGDDPYNE